MACAPETPAHPSSDRFAATFSLKGRREESAGAATRSLLLRKQQGLCAELSLRPKRRHMSPLLPLRDFEATAQPQIAPVERFETKKGWG